MLTAEVIRDSNKILANFHKDFRDISFFYEVCLLFHSQHTDLVSVGFMKMITDTHISNPQMHIICCSGKAPNGQTILICKCLLIICKALKSLKLCLDYCSIGAWCNMQLFLMAPLELLLIEKALGSYFWRSAYGFLNKNATCFFYSETVK